MASIKDFKNISKSEIRDSENIYHLKTDITRISKLIYHYEIYKKILELPGDFIECGVFKGISLTRFLTFRKILENEHSRGFYGFDMFGKFAKARNIKDKNFVKKWVNEAGDGISLDELIKIFNKKKFENYELIKGDIKNTLPKFLEKNPHIKISMLHLDLDIYEPTKFALDKLVKKIVKGGIILIDDYNSVYGATKAVDEFLKKNSSLKIKKLNFYKLPAYIVIN